MNKITNYILILLLFFLCSCGYKAVLNNQNYQFSINVVKIEGDQKINSQIMLLKFKIQVFHLVIN